MPSEPEQRNVIHNQQLIERPDGSMRSLTRSEISRLINETKCQVLIIKKGTKLGLYEPVKYESISDGYPISSNVMMYDIKCLREFTKLNLQLRTIHFKTLHEISQAIYCLIMYSNGL